MAKYGRLFTALMLYLAAYLITGILACAIVAFIGRKRGKTDFTPLSFVLGNEPLFLFLGLVFWPIWIGVQLVEWSNYGAHQNRPPTSPPPPEPGTAGVAVTQLRPSGKVRIGQTVLDATAESGLIEPGHEIEVLARTPTGVRVKTKPSGK